jgi:hypothetical protein
MKEEEIFGALIGLAGAATQNGKTADTDEIIRRALTSPPSEDVLGLIHGEKHRIAPNCATCAYPCGNTSDYDMSLMESNPAEVRKLKGIVMEEVKAVAARTTGEMPESVYDALCYLSYDLSAESYEALLEEMKP